VARPPAPDSGTTQRRRLRPAAGYGDAVGAARSDAARYEAIVVVVCACGRYHTRGSPGGRWPLRWASRRAPSDNGVIRMDPAVKDPGAVDRAAIATRVTQRPTAASSSAERRILFAAGHPKPGRNDFATEAATIRSRVMPAGIDLHDHSCVEIGELAGLPARLRPVAHLPQQLVLQHGGEPGWH
jgi:hypothetical protein